MTQTSSLPGPAKLLDLNALEWIVSKFVSVTPVESALTRSLASKSFRICTYEKRWGRGGPDSW